MNLDQEVKLIAMKASNESSRKIAAEIGVNKSTVNRVAQRKDIKEQIKSLQARVITELSETAFNNVKHAINYYANPITLLRYTDNKGKMHVLKVVDDQLREHGAKFSLEVMRAAGALPSHNLSIVIQNTFNDNRQEIPDVIKDILREVTRRDLNEKNLLAGFEDDTSGRKEPLNDFMSEPIDISEPSDPIGRTRA